MRQLKADGSKGRAHGAAERAVPAAAHSVPVLLSGVRIHRMKGTAYRSAVRTPGAKKPSPYKKPYTEESIWKATKENSFPFWNLPES